VKQTAVLAVSSLINKSTCPERPNQRGYPGYSWILVARILIYAAIRGFHNNSAIVVHLKNNPDIAKALGFETIPHRTTISRWRRRWWILTEVIEKLGGMVQKLVPTTLLIVDSAPIPDENDPDARKGKTSKGWFNGFKIHVSVNQMRIPLKAVFTTGNESDMNFLGRLIHGIIALFLLADKGYDSKVNRLICRSQRIKPIIIKNKRNSKNKPKQPALLILAKKFRFLVEQFNSLLKTETLNEKWYQFKGFAKKATTVYAGVIAVQVMGIYGLQNGEKNPLRISMYRY